MERITVETHPIEGQKPGTSGLRKKTLVFMGEHYLENFVQSIWNGIGGAEGKTFVLGEVRRAASGVAFDQAHQTQDELQLLLCIRAAGFE